MPQLDVNRPPLEAETPLAAGLRDLTSLASEAGEAVEVFLPSPLLSSGMCLVDTPGIGSVFAGNTMTTHEFVPHVDAAIVVLGAEPPISGEELALVEEVSRHVEKLFFVLNKADRLPAGQSDEAARFTERVLKESLGPRLMPLLMISAAERLLISAAERLNSGPTRDWEKLESSLDHLARESGASLVRDAEQRAIKRFLERLIAEIDEQRDALVRPVAEKRIGSLSASVAEAERSMADLGYLLMAEVDRLTKKFGEDRESFLSAALERATQELIRQIDTAASETSLRPLRARIRDVAAAIARRHLDAWLATEQPAAEALYRGAAERFLALRVRESRRRLEAEIRSRLSEAVRSAVSALDHAMARHVEGEASVAAELARLDGLRRRAAGIGDASARR